MNDFLGNRAAVSLSVSAWLGERGEGQTDILTRANELEVTDLGRHYDTSRTAGCRGWMHARFILRATLQLYYKLMSAVIGSTAGSRDF